MVGCLLHKWKNHLYMITMIVFYHILYDWIYSWTCLQWPPWGQKEVATVKRWPLQRGLNKSECMDCPPEKMAIVEKWPLVQVRLYMYMILRNCPGTYPSPFTELNTNLSFRAKCWVRGGLGRYGGLRQVFQNHTDACCQKYFLTCPTWSCIPPFSMNSNVLITMFRAFFPSSEPAL